VSKLRLDSWKTIAEYLERSQRTVQRWHGMHALPVHHFGGRRGSVFAYAEEIDLWLLKLAEDAPPAIADGDERLETRRQSSYDLTARAAELWETHSEESLHTIAGLYRKAIDQYPSNVSALSGLAKTMISAVLEGAMSSTVAYPCAMEALRRAAQVDSQDVGATCGAAWMYLLYERKWRHARTAFVKVLSKQPQSAFALAGLSLLAIGEGDLYMSSFYAWEAWRQKTLVSSLGALVCWTQYLAGDMGQALELVCQVRASGGGGVMLGTIEALALARCSPSGAQLQRVEAIAANYCQSQTLQGVLGYVYAANKQSALAWEILQRLEKAGAKQKHCAYGLAILLGGLNRKQEAARWLEAEYGERSLWSLGFRTDPMLVALCGEPRYEAILRNLTNNAVSGMQTASPVMAMARAIG